MRVTKKEFLPRDIMWKVGILMRSKGWVQMTGGVLLFCLIKNEWRVACHQEMAARCRY